MGIGETLNKNKALGFGIVGACLVVVIGIVVWQVMSGGPPSDIPAAGNVHFFDVTTGTTFQRSESEVPPIKAPSGAQDADGAPAGARLYRFSCTSCEDTASQFDGYIEKFTPEAQAELLKVFSYGDGNVWDQLPPSAKVGLEKVRADGRRIAKPEAGATWVTQSSPEAAAILKAIKDKCGNGVPQECKAGT